MKSTRWPMQEVYVSLKILALIPRLRLVVKRGPSELSSAEWCSWGCCNTKTVQNVVATFCTGQIIAAMFWPGQNVTATFWPGQIIVAIFCPVQIIAATFWHGQNVVTIFCPGTKCRCHTLYRFGLTTTPIAHGVVVTPKRYTKSQRHFGRDKLSL